MKKDIDLKDLIKIVTDIENKYRTTPIKKEEVNYHTSKDLEAVFNSDMSIVEKLNELKMYEQSNPTRGLSGMQDQFLYEAQILDKITLYEDYYNSFYSTAGVLSQMDAYPSYRKMTLLELKRYLTWRTKLRNGVFTFANSKYIYTYVNEIYCSIGIKNKNEGFDILMFMLDNLILLSPRNENIFKQIVLEYIYLNNIEIEKTMSYDLFKNLFVYRESIFKDETKETEVLTEYILNNFSSETSFCTTYQKEIKTILRNVINKISKYLSRHNYSLKNLIYKYKTRIEEFKYINILIPLNNLSLYQTRNNIKILEMLDIEFTNNKVFYKEAVSEYKYSSILRYIIHRIEYLLRKKYRDRSIKKKQYPVFTINNDFDKLLLSTEFIDLIENQIKDDAEKEIIIKEEVKIDLSKLDQIRVISNEVSSKLITEADMDFEEEVKVEEKEIEKTDNIWHNLFNSLTVKERNFLKIFIETSSIINLKQYCKDINMLLEVIVESINEKSMENIEDNIIELYDDEIIIYDDYIENIQEMLEGESR